MTQETLLLELESRFPDFFKITLNQAQCALCNDIITSRHRHDFVSCKCGEIFIDGGNEYVRAGANSFDNFRSMVKTRPMTLEEVKHKMEVSERYKMTTSVEQARAFAKEMYLIAL